MNRIERPHVTLYDRPLEPDWKGGCGLMAAVALVFFILGFIVATNLATPRPAQPTAPQPSASGTAGTARVPALAPTSASAAPTEAPLAPTGGASTVTGLASYVRASLGDTYLALPEGPGTLAIICHATRCRSRVSTDAGPDLAMQRAGRVADLSFADFAYLCQCDPRVPGVITVTVQRGAGATLPPTDLEESR